MFDFLGAVMLLGMAAPMPFPAQDDPVIDVPADDPELRAAIVRARAGLPVFFRHATAPGPGETGFLVKFAIVPQGRGEFVWGEVIAHQGDETLVRLANTPRAPGFALGQQLRVRDGEVVDWAYWRDGAMVGGATIRVLIARMPPAAARALRDRLGW